MYQSQVKTYALCEHALERRVCVSGVNSPLENVPTWKMCLPAIRMQMFDTLYQ